MSWLLFGGLVEFFIASLNGIADAQNANSRKAEILKSPIVVQLKVEEKTIQQRLRILVSYVFTNTGRRKVRIEERLVSLNFGGLPPGLGVIDGSGYGVRYIGQFFNPGHGYRDALITFKPGESRSIREADITDCFNWPVEAQKITITYRNYSMVGKNLLLVKAKPVTFDYIPVVTELRVPLEKWPRKRADVFAE